MFLRAEPTSKSKAAMRSCRELQAGIQVALLAARARVRFFFCAGDSSGGVESTAGRFEGSADAPDIFRVPLQGGDDTSGGFRRTLSYLSKRTCVDSLNSELPPLFNKSPFTTVLTGRKVFFEFRISRKLRFGGGITKFLIDYQKNSKSLVDRRSKCSKYVHTVDNVFLFKIVAPILRA